MVRVAENFELVQKLTKKQRNVYDVPAAKNDHVQEEKPHLEFKLPLLSHHSPYFRKGYHEKRSESEIPQEVVGRHYAESPNPVRLNRLINPYGIANQI